MFVKAAKIMIYQITGAFSVFILYVILARFLGEEGFGEYIFVYTIILSMTTIAKGGLDLAAVKYVSIYRDNERWDLLKGFRYFALNIVLITSLLLSLIWLLFISYTNEIDRIKEIKELMVMGTPLIIILSIMFLSAGIIRGLGEYTQALAPQTVVYPTIVVVLTLIYLLVGSTKPEPEYVIIIAFISSSIIVFWQNKRIRKILRKGMNIKAVFLRKDWLSNAIPMGLTNGMQVFMGQIDIIIVGMLQGTVVAGIYAVASRIVLISRFGVNALSFLVAPIYSRLYSKGDISEIQKISSRAVKVTFTLSVPIFIILIIISEYILPFFGDKFIVALPVIYILLVGELVNVISGYNGPLLNMSGKHINMTKIYLVVLFIEIVFLLTFTLMWGIIGAAIAVVSAIIIQDILIVTNGWKSHGVNSTLFSKHVWGGKGKITVSRYLSSNSKTYK